MKKALAALLLGVILCLSCAAARDFMKRTGDILVQRGRDKVNSGQGTLDIKDMLIGLGLIAGGGLLGGGGVALKNGRKK